MAAQSNLESVLTPVNLAKGLPNENYVSDEVFEEEKRIVLFRNWSGIGFGSDVPEAGDAKPVEFKGIPLLLVRDHDGSVGVFQNTCRHRGMILIPEPTRLRGAIRCPYHSWCYELSGALRTTPHFGGPGRNTHADVNRDELGLFRVRSYVWRDVVFVNVSGDAPEFTEVHAGLMARWADAEKPLYHNGSDSSITLDLNCNWKLAVENFCESYHLPWVHPGMNSYSRLQDHYNIAEADEYSGQGTLVYRQLRGPGGATFPDFEGLSENWDEGAEYIAVYPNVLLGVQRDHAFAFAFVLMPIDKGRTQERINLYYASQRAVGDDYRAMRGANSQLWKTVFEEEVFVVEGMQKGRHGPMFDGGKFSPEMDGPTHCFHHWVATRLEAGRSRPDHEHRYSTSV